MAFETVLERLNLYVPLIRSIITIIIFYLIFNFILSKGIKKLRSKIRTKKQISNLEIFGKVFRIIIIIILALFAIFSYYGSWASFGLSVGLISAALGWALQKPITGFAGWVMLVTKRPFEIGDRITIGDIVGDVMDITITHIYLYEVGGIVSGDVRSGRIVLIPNSIMFEQKITNYTLLDDYIQGQVNFTVPFNSDVAQAQKIGEDAAREAINDTDAPKHPYTRVKFHEYGISIYVKFYCPAKELYEKSSVITRIIYDNICKAKDLEFAYPHTEVIYRKK